MRRENLSAAIANPARMHLNRRNRRTSFRYDQPFPWSDSVFAEAKSEHRFVLLDLGTLWCHWCHVMDEVTYRDPEVIDLVRKRYIAVRVDADSRPDLSNRYEDYGWPATIVFNSDGEEIVKRRGYLPPRSMASMLQAIIDDPTPGPSVVQEVPLTPGTESALTSDARNELRQILVERYDSRNRGWGTIQKFIDADIIEYSIGCTADRAWLKRAEDAANFVDANFKDDSGYVSAAAKGALKSKPELDENVGLARFANLLFHYSGKTGYRELAKHAMRFLVTPQLPSAKGSTDFAPLRRSICRG